MNDLFYFKHYSGWSDKEEMQDIEDEFGFVGVAVFFKFIEKQSIANGYKIDCDKLKRLKSNIRFDGSNDEFMKIINGMIAVELLTIKDEKIFNKFYFQEFSKSDQEKSKRVASAKKAGKASAAKRKESRTYEPTTRSTPRSTTRSTDVPTSVQRSVNDIEYSIEEKSIVENSIVKNSKEENNKETIKALSASPRANNEIDLLNLNDFQQKGETASGAKEEDKERKSSAKKKESAPAKKSLEERQADFEEQVRAVWSKLPENKRFHQDYLIEFVEYWNECSDGGNKTRREKQQTFSITSRISMRIRLLTSWGKDPFAAIGFNKIEPQQPMAEKNYVF